MRSTVPILVLLMLAAYLQATNGLFPTFIGAKAGGRGGADIAVGNDATAIDSNPAGIAFIPGKMVDFTFGGFYPRIEMNNALNRAESDIEFSPFGSLGVVWDSPGQSLEVFSDPFSWTFGGEPESSYAPSKGDAFFAWDTTALPRQLCLTIEGEGSVSDIRVYGVVVPSDHILWQTDHISPLPAGARVSGIRAHFEWQSPSAPAEIILTAEGVQAKLSLSETSETWHKGYLAVAWERTIAPAYISLTSQSDAIRIRNFSVSINYQFGSESIWKDVHVSDEEFSPQRQSQKILLVSDSTVATVKEGVPAIVALGDPTLPPGYELIGLYVYYHYDLTGLARNPFLKAELTVEGNEIASNLHLPPARENVPDGRVLSRMRSDFEIPHPEKPSGFKFGFGVFPQTGGRFNINTRTIFFPEGIDNRVNQTFISVSPAIAYRFNDFFSIGVALHANLYIFELDGLTAQDSLILRGNPPGLPPGSTTFGEALRYILDVPYIRGESDTNRLFGYGLGGRVGLMWKVTDRLALGAVYSPRTFMQRTKGDALVDFTRHFSSNPLFALIAGLTLPNGGQYGFASTYEMEIEFDLPQRAGVGISYLPWDNLLLSADFEWIDYSDTMDTVQLIFHEGSNPDMNAVATTRVHGEVNSNWKDQYIAGVGMVWQPAAPWTVRVGYNYGTNPVSKEHLDPRFPAIIQHHVMMGMTYQVSADFEVSALVEWGLPAKLKSEGENFVHPDLTYTELKIYTLAAVFGLNWNF